MKCDFGGFGVRLHRFMSRVNKAKLQGFLVHSSKNIYYLTGFMSSGGAHLLAHIDSDPVLWVGRLEWERAKEEVGNCDLRMIKRRIRVSKTLSKELSGAKLGTIGFDELAAKEYLELVGDWEGELRFEPQLIWELRKVKDEEEKTRTRKAAKLADIGMQIALETIAPGVEEFKVAAEAEYAMRVRRSEGTAFETIVASGPRSAFPHSPPTTRRIRSGDLVVVDIGATFKYYRSDITRTIVVGKPSESQKKIFDTVIQAQESASKKYVDGEKCSLVDRTARSIIRKRGYGRYFVHSLGHGIGLDIHEPPTISANSKDRLKAGNLVSNEPGIYVPSVGGVRIEDMILVGLNSWEILTSTPRDIEV